MVTARRRLPSGHVPLERALSKLGIASRAEARRLVLAGRVRVDGVPASDPEMPVVPERSALAVDGEPVAAAAPLVVMLHKPRGVVTTRTDPQGRTTVYSCLAGVPGLVMPFGRLDAATSGLLLLGNDSRLGDWLTDPAQGVPRVYLATVRGELDEAGLEVLVAGVEDGGERLQARDVVVRKRSRRESHLVVTLTTGKNREVRRLLAAVGHEVTRLKRVAFGPLALGDLAPGRWRAVPREELAAAFPDAPLRPASR